MWNESFAPTPSHLILSALSVDFHNRSVAVGQEGYPGETQCYYKPAWAANWAMLFTDTRY